MNKSQTLEIISLAYGGDGFGRLEDGRACFVPFTLPGEQVKVQLTDIILRKLKRTHLLLMSVSMEEVMFHSYY